MRTRLRIATACLPALVITSCGVALDSTTSAVDTEVVAEQAGPDAEDAQSLASATAAAGITASEDRRVAAGTGPEVSSPAPGAVRALDLPLSGPGTTRSFSLHELADHTLRLEIVDGWRVLPIEAVSRIRPRAP